MLVCSATSLSQTRRFQDCHVVWLCGPFLPRMCLSTIRLRLLVRDSLRRVLLLIRSGVEKKPMMRTLTLGKPLTWTAVPFFPCFCPCLSIQVTYGGSWSAQERLNNCSFGYEASRTGDDTFHSSVDLRGVALNFLTSDVSRTRRLHDASSSQSRSKATALWPSRQVRALRFES